MTKIIPINTIDLFAPTEPNAKEDTNMTIRISKDLLGKFEKLCKERNVKKSIVIRRFMESQIQIDGERNE